MNLLLELKHIQLEENEIGAYDLVRIYKKKDFEESMGMIYDMDVAIKLAHYLENQIESGEIN